MDNKFARKTIKERLILSGIDEIGNCGVAGFSLRQVAVSCNVSCATPYNYFKNKEGFSKGFPKKSKGAYAKGPKK